MKINRVLFTILFAITSIICFYVPIRAVLVSCTPKKETIGLNQPYWWSKSETVSVDGVFSVKSPVYFELRQENQVRRSDLEDPLPGEDRGTYWVRDFPMTGNWDISGSGNLFSEKETSFTHVCSDSIVGVYFILAFLVGAILWLLQFELMNLFGIKIA